MEGNIGSNPIDISLSDVSADLPLKAREPTKAKNKQMRVHQHKKPCTAKATIIKMRRHPTQ